MSRDFIGSAQGREFLKSPNWDRVTRIPYTGFGFIQLLTFHYGFEPFVNGEGNTKVYREITTTESVEGFGDFTKDISVARCGSGRQSIFFSSNPYNDWVPPGYWVDIFPDYNNPATFTEDEMSFSTTSGRVDPRRGITIGFTLKFKLSDPITLDESVANLLARLESMRLDSDDASRAYLQTGSMNTSTLACNETLFLQQPPNGCIPVSSAGVFKTALSPFVRGSLFGVSDTWGRIEGQLFAFGKYYLRGVPIIARKGVFRATSSGCKRKSQFTVSPRVDSILSVTPISAGNIIRFEPNASFSNPEFTANGSAPFFSETTKFQLEQAVLNTEGSSIFPFCDTYQCPT